MSVTMDDFFFKEPAEGKSNSMKAYKNNRIKHLNVPFKNATVILMNHPVSLCLYKYVSVTVLSGTVSINGYELNKEKSVKVFSSEKTGLLEIKTETYESIWKKKTSPAQLEGHLTNLFQSNRNICKRILEECGNSTVIVYIKRCALPTHVEFSESYCPRPFEFSLYKKNAAKDMLFLKNTESPLRFSEEVEKLACEIVLLIRSAKLTESNNPRILVYGPRNSGKSTLLKYLINKMLSQYQRVYYLDTDPGQPEFTPPGVLSLTKLENPILEPSFFHQKKESKMIFTGDVSPSFVDLYCKNVSTLVESYRKEHADEPLFVNTMGWLDGTGLHCLINTITAVKPTVLVEIVANGQSPMFDYRDYLPPESRYFQISCSDQERKPILSAKELREVNLLSHLGQCQRSHLGVLPLNEIEPYCVSWEEIPIFVFPGRSIQRFRLAEAVNESIVALCIVSENAILKSENPDFPPTLESDPENECLAYGLVQAVDEKEKMLYIISPLKAEEWKRVNAIIKGNIMVPNCLILQQEIYNVPLPYTDVTENFSNDEEEMDVSMVSLKYVSEAETETPEPKQKDLNMFPPLENCRKPAGSRYSQKFFKKFMKK